MGKNFRRIIVIAVLTVLWVSLAVLGLRKTGLNDQFQAFDHPLLKQKFWIIAWNEKMSKSSFEKAAKLSPDIILGAAVQSLRGGELVLADKHYLLHESKTLFLRNLSLEQWKDYAPEAMTLNEFIDNFSHRKIYLNLDRLNILNNARLYKSLGPLQDSKNVLIKSSPQGIKKSLKEKQPWWLFSNTTAEIGKFKLMQALYLETVARLNADFFVDKSFSPRALNEIRRRHKKAIYRHSPDEPEALLKAKIYDGVVTARPSEFISLVD